ncbi:MAG: hypothetical protein NDI61_07410 [Bdellovibrionaceae bacterium]|nr:hypothetical protein [Pseudobdellovibrionaceae bacterium]
MAPFVAQNCTLAALWDIQRTNWRADIWKLPLNALWSVVYFGLKKFGESLDKAGWDQPLHILEHMPVGFRTSIHGAMETRLANELFVSDQGFEYSNVVRKELKKYSLARATLASFSATASTLILGWLIFDQGSLGAMDLIRRLSERVARDRAASDFVFGEGVGRVFYGVFSPSVSWTDTVLSLAFYGVFLALVAFVVAVAYYPLRAKLGLEQRRLIKCIDDLEQRLIVESHRRLRESSKN